MPTPASSSATAAGLLIGALGAFAVTRLMAGLLYGIEPGDPIALAGAIGTLTVVSGGARNGDELEGLPAILDFPLGRGHIVAFNFNPMHRELNRSDYRLLWNAILNWRAIVETGGS